MVMTWQENEDNCVNFLNDYYGDYFKLMVDVTPQVVIYIIQRWCKFLDRMQVD